MRPMPPSSLAALAFLALTACGGGGGDEDSVPSISASVPSLQVEQMVSEQARTLEFSVTASWSPPDGLYADMTSTGPAIAQADWTSTRANRADVVVTLESPADLLPGVYAGEIQFKVCTDEHCDKAVRNSPIRVPISLTVRPAPPVEVVADPAEIMLVARNHSGAPPRIPVSFSVDVDLGQPPTVSSTYSSSIVDEVVQTETSSADVSVEVLLVQTDRLTDGTHNGFVDVELCYSESCVNKLATAPVRIPVSYTVALPNALPEPGVEPLVPSSTQPLSHDVVDAEYSKTLDAIVMASTYPDTALYLYDAASGNEAKLLLTKSPTAVSVGPDGSSAAVAHDGLVTYVDLAELSARGSSMPVLLDVSADAFDVVLDGRGVAHVLPESDQWVNLHSVDAATNTESLGIGTFYERERGKLHPSQHAIYAVNNGLSPDDMEKLDITGTPAIYQYGSPYHGQHPFCSNLWISEDGLRIFTACGNIFAASTLRAEDMVYMDVLRLWDPDPWAGYRIRSLSESLAASEIALIEFELRECRVPPPPRQVCRTHLALFDTESLDRLATYSFAPMWVGGHPYGQQGLMVFHRSSGTGMLAITKLDDMPDPDSEFYLLELPQ